VTTFSGDTDTVHMIDLKSEVRAFFSATGVRLGEEVWLTVETRWVADGTPVTIELFRQDGAGGREILKKLDGQIAGDLWEQRWKVEVPKERLDDLHGPVYVCFEVELGGHEGPSRSQMLLVHRTRFSS
jgi:hypothetical protein